MIKGVYGLFFFVLFAYSASGQLAVSGRVSDNLNNPIDFSWIQLSNTKYYRVFDTRTDSNGEYRFDSLVAGYYTLQMKALGCQTEVVQIQLKQDTVLHFTAKKAPFEMEEIVVLDSMPALIQRGMERQKEAPIVDVNCAVDSVKSEGSLHPDEVLDYLKNYLTYPDSAKNFSIQGKVRVLVTFDSLGNVSQVELVNSVFRCIDNKVKSAFLTLPTVTIQAPSLDGNDDRFNANWFEAGTYLFPINFVLR